MNDLVPSIPNNDNKLIAEVEKMYSNFVKEETNKQVQEQQTQTVQEFDKTRQLGFATVADVDKLIAGTFTKLDTELRAEMKQLREEMTAVREVAFRAKMQGINNGTQDTQVQQRPENNPLMAYAIKGMRT